MQVDKVVNKVEEISWGQIIEFLRRFLHLIIQTPNTLMNFHDQLHQHEFNIPFIIQTSFRNFQILG